MATNNRQEISMDTNARVQDLEKEVADLKAEVREMVTICKKHSEKTEELHTYLLKAPPGEVPLIQRIGVAVKAFENSSWLGKRIIWAIMTLGGLTVAGGQILDLLKGGK